MCYLVTLSLVYLRFYRDGMKKENSVLGYFSYGTALNIDTGVNIGVRDVKICGTC
jgi:hypothetical protein